MMSHFGVIKTLLRSAVLRHFLAFHLFIKTRQYIKNQFAVWPSAMFFNVTIHIWLLKSSAIDLGTRILLRALSMSSGDIGHVFLPSSPNTFTRYTTIFILHDSFVPCTCRQPAAGSLPFYLPPKRRKRKFCSARRDRVAQRERTNTYLVLCYLLQYLVSKEEIIGGIEYTMTPAPATNRDRAYAQSLFADCLQQHKVLYNTRITYV